MNKKILFLCGFILLNAWVYAQNKEIEITSFSSNLFANKSGIMDMVQDLKGNIWMLHSTNGLSKYDGETMRLFTPNPQDPNSISAGRLEGLFIDKQGIIWISTHHNGIDRFDPSSEKFTHYENDPKNKKSLRSNRTRAFVEDDDGFIWVGTNIGLDKMDPKTGEFIHFFSTDPDFAVLDQQFIRVLYKDKSGILWIGCGNPFGTEDSTQGGLFKFDRKKDEITRYAHSEVETSLINNTVSAIFEDSKGVFWVGTAGDGLHTMDREKGAFKRHLNDPNFPNKLSRPPLGDIISFSVDFITFINEDAQGFIWIGTYEGGLNRYDPKSATTTYYGLKEFETVSFWNLMKTKDDLLWISLWATKTPGDRLFKINISPNNIKYTELGSEVNAMIEIEENKILIGTKKGLFEMDSLGHFHTTPDTIFQNTNIINLAKDSANNLWISTNKGACFYDISRKAYKVYRHRKSNKNSISNDTINVILPLDGQNVLIGTGKSGLDVLNQKEETIKNYSHDEQDSNSITSNNITSLLQDSYGTIWVGTGFNGINKFNLETGQFKPYGPLGSIREIFEDSKRRVWIGTRNLGLWYYDLGTDQLISFLDDSGLLASYFQVSGIREDKQENLWLKTSLGPIKLSLKDGTAFLMADDGKGNATYNSRAVFISSKGKILFGEHFGFIELNAATASQSKQQSNVPFINKFYVNNDLIEKGQVDLSPISISETKAIGLKHFQNSFTFEYGHVDFISPSSMHNIQFKLENYDVNWLSSKEENKAAYFKVPPGDYVFKIRASNPNGIFTTKSINVTIRKPWYQTGWAYLLFALLGAAILRAYILFRARKMQTENKRLEDKVEARTAELKASQALLIHSEKMASLGELTAGIAHEIQNPLNFVNNFSDVNKELIEEMMHEIKKGNIEEAEIIGKDILDNENKILHHGQRADSIVKSMLQHSRTSRGEKTLTDINALCDEYLRLAYHGLRAKDKSFHADFKTEFDLELPKINVIPQDIGRVLLNLINNAFHAVHEKAMTTKDQNYKPTVKVKTELAPLKGGLGGDTDTKITISDNGSGIPDNIKDKIFQPFFTTKPTGEGTGLGLSLSYDIVKAHGGELKVVSTFKEGLNNGGSTKLGTEFKVRLPI